MERVEKLLLWAKENGVSYSDGLKFVYNDVFGFTAVTEEAQHVDIHVPSELMITNSKAKSDLNMDSVVPNALLKLYTAKLRAEGVNKYVMALPSMKQLDSPLIWGPQDMAHLEGSNMYGFVREKLEAIHEEWKTLVGSKTDHDLSNLEHDESDWKSFPAYLWASLVVLSRAFPEHILTGDRDCPDAMLVPVIDLLNHKNYSRVDWICDNNGFKLATEGAGGEVFNNYGAKSNEELLLGYGFVLEENDFDYVALKVKGHDVFYLKPEYDMEPLISTFVEIAGCKPTLQGRLKGMSVLRHNLEYKQNLISATYDDTHRAQMCEIYKASQRSILKSTVKKLKSLEKEILVNHRDEMFSAKTIFKKDTKFIEFLESLFGELTFDSFMDLEILQEALVYWIALQAEKPSNPKFSWVGDKCTAATGTADVDQLFATLTNLNASIDKTTLSKAKFVYDEIVFARPEKNEIIFINC